tara:strand:- start:165 stop:449 length:285 start_codon:yes stop_codon:yes gene_type:complete
MSNFTRKDNTASMFKNSFKEKDSQPDMKGEAMVDGVEYKMACWKKKSEKSGDTYYSFNFQNKAYAEEMYGKKSEGGSNEKASKANTTDSEDLPF